MPRYEILVPVTEYDLYVIEADNIDDAYNKVRDNEADCVETARSVFTDYDSMELLAIDGEEI